MPNMINGMQQTMNINQTQREIDVSSKIALLQPDKAPLTALLRRLNKKVATNPIFHWFEDDLQARWDAVNNAAGYSNSATSIVVDTGDLFKVGDIVKVPRTGEVMRVTAVSGNTLTVVRGVGTTAAAALQDNDTLLILGNANKEGGLAVEAQSTQVATIFNYTQIFKTSVKVSKTLAASNLHTGDERTYQRRKKAIEHAVDIERAFLFGEKSETVSNGDVIRTTGGVLSFLTAGASNVLDVSANGILSEDTLEAYLETLFRYGSSSKLCLAGPRLITVINSYGRDKIQLNPKAAEYGLKIYTYISAHGELNLVKHPLLENAYAKYGIILDLENLAYRPLQGRDTKLNTEIQPPDADYFLDEYLTEAGLELKLPKTHGLIIGANAKA